MLERVGNDLAEDGNTRELCLFLIRSLYEDAREENM